MSFLETKEIFLCENPKKKINQRKNILLSMKNELNVLTDHKYFNQID